MCNPLKKQSRILEVPLAYYQVYNLPPYQERNVWQLASRNRDAQETAPQLYVPGILP